MAGLNTKRVAKNTAFLYVRMIFMTIISLYTSRVVLQQLGVEDYGVYGVVGAIVSMFNSLRTVFSSSTQRFLTYEMGRGNEDKLSLVFNMSIYINILISLVFVVVVEIVGYWFLNYKINVDLSRLLAAKWVFQFSIASAVVSIMITPYDAALIAHERMDFYAYVSIFDAIMRLAVVFILSCLYFDKLIIYAILLFSVSLIGLLINLIYCQIQFRECHLCRCWDKEYFKKMTVFAGWNFFGNTAFALSSSGVNLVLNVYGGPVVNAARDIAYQVSNALSKLINNIGVAIKPFAIKTYAEGNVKKAYDILYLSSKVFFFIQLISTIVFAFFAEELIYFWLGQIPKYVVVFLQLVIFHALIRSIHAPLDLMFYSVGDLKYYQIAECVILSLPVAFSYFALSLGMSYYSVFIIIIFCEIVNLVVIVKIAQKICNLNISIYLKKVIVPCLITASAFIVLLGFNKLIADTLFMTILCALLSVVACSTSMYITGLSRSEKQLIKDKIHYKKD